MRFYQLDSSAVIADDAGLPVYVFPLNALQARAQGDTVFIFTPAVNNPVNTPLYSLPYYDCNDQGGVPLGGSAYDVLLALCSIFNFVPASPTPPTPTPKMPQVYSAAYTGLSPTGASTDIFALKGVVGKKVNILGVDVSATKTGTDQTIDILFLIRTSENTGGNPQNIKPTKFVDDSDNLPLGQAVVFKDPATVGSLKGLISTHKVIIKNTTAISEMLDDDFTDYPQQPQILVNEYFCINFNNANITGESLDIYVIFSVEDL